MAQSYATSAGVLIIPGAYPTIQVAQGSSGLSTTGVIFLVGEADGGPDFTLEADLSENVYGADQLSDVVSKYLSGPLVDAYRAASVPANDPQIQGAPSSFVLVKTNPSTKSSSALTKVGGGTYGTIYDKNYGSIGNLIYYTITQATAEVKPTTGAFTFIPPVGTVDLNVRVNGGADEAVSLSANETPAAFVAAVSALTGISCTGGANRGIVGSVSGTLALAATGNSVTVTYSSNWTVAPVVGDTLVIPAGSAIEGGANQNVGAYVVTAVGTNTVSATKLSDAGKGGAVIGTVTAPVTVSATSVVATTDVEAFGSVTVTLSASAVVPGIGKSLEINQLTTGTDLLSRCLYVLGTTSPVTWVSAQGAPKLIVSSAEQAVSLNVNRQMDNVTETLVAGGPVMLKLGYTGSTAQVVVGPTTMVFTVTGGSGANLSIDLTKFPTLSDLATYINSQPGYTAAVGSNALGQQSPLQLDEGTFTMGSDFGNATLRLKADAVAFFMEIVNGSVLVQLGKPPATASCGLPALVASSTYLAGGARGGTTDAIYDAALAGIESVPGNFVVPLFSRDATADIADGITDSSSTYTISNVQAAAKSHVNAMSTLKKRKNRQAFLSQRDTFANVKEAAATLAAYRCSLTLQDEKVVGANGIVQAQPWMGAALAAGMQAAGFYLGIVHKGINCSGVVQAAGDFNPANDSQLEDALKSGLLVAQKTPQGGFWWVSDQTTYLKDNNFVYNSIQAVYLADTIALTCSQRMEQAFVGQSVADVSSALALSALEAIMGDFLRLKLIAVSDDAPKGFKNASVRISGTTMVVSVEVKLAGLIYFIPINFLVSQVTQSASAAA